jgi:Protein of unknown function (DUF2934)
VPPPAVLVARGGPLIPASLRLDMIRDAAYFRAEARGFAPGKEIEDWMAAEQDVDELILRRYGGWAGAGNLAEASAEASAGCGAAARGNERLLLAIVKKLHQLVTHYSGDFVLHPMAHVVEFETSYEAGETRSHLIEGQRIEFFQSIRLSPDKKCRLSDLRAFEGRG